jgi:hypothetical protein
MRRPKRQQIHRQPTSHKFVRRSPMMANNTAGGGGGQMGHRSTNLPGIGQFALLTRPPRHHPHCAESGRFELDELAGSERHGSTWNDDEFGQTSAEAFPLSPDALRAIDAIEYITDHLHKEEEHKTVE